MVRSGLKAIYLSGWQVAADSNVAGSMYPDQSLYPANSGPELARKINKTLQRADQIEHMEGGAKRDLVRADHRRRGGRFRWTAQLLRDHEGLYRGGRFGVHFEDQLASEKKCGHLGGKVLIPTQAAIRTSTRHALRPTSAVFRRSSSLARTPRAPS